MKRPEIVNATQAELDEILALAKTSFPSQQYKLLEGVLGTFVYVMQALQSAKTSIKRFRSMLFGAATESQRNLLAPLDAGGASDVASATGAKPVRSVLDQAPAKVPAPGHGRNGAQAYSDSPVVQVELLDLNPGDLCPQCEDGKVYNSPPRTLVKMVGQAPIAATIYELSRLRCRLCDTIFTAVLPAGVFDSKYDHSCASMLALLRYGSGMPFYRLQGLQANLNVPLADATQWDIMAKALPGPKAAFKELILQAAQAPLLHNDDTPARILELMAARTKAERSGQEPKRCAINTSGIVAVLQEHKVVSKDILHKSDAGGVKLNLRGEEGLRKAYDQIIDSCKVYDANADIEGMLVTTMARRGLEVIIGVMRDPIFGPVLMFGLGGIFVEILKDVSFRAIPLSRYDANAMVEQIKARKMLEGVRGEAAVDKDALVDLMLKISGIVEAYPEMAELDLNPVILYDDGYAVVDARVIVDRPGAQRQGEH